MSIRSSLPSVAQARSALRGVVATPLPELRQFQPLDVLEFDCLKWVGGPDYKRMVDLRSYVFMQQHLRVAPMARAINYDRLPEEFYLQDRCQLTYAGSYGTYELRSDWVEAALSEGKRAAKCPCPVYTSPNLPDGSYSDMSLADSIATAIMV